MIYQGLYVVLESLTLGEPVISPGLRIHSLRLQRLLPVLPRLNAASSSILIGPFVIVRKPHQGIYAGIVMVGDRAEVRCLLLVLSFALLYCLSLIHI